MMSVYPCNKFHFSGQGVLFLLLILSLFATDLMAGKVQRLYEAEVPVAGSTTEQRNEAIQAAFVQVLVKVTGDRRVGSRPELEKELKKASRYVQQYRFRLDPNSRDILPPSVVTESQNVLDESEVEPQEPPRLLWASFDAGAVDRLLRQYQLPVWGDNRPVALVWLGMERKGKRQLVALDRMPDLFDEFSAAANGRGLPVILPLMDLEDRGRLREADLWGNFEQNIRNASERYAPDVILTARFKQLAEGEWRGDWRLYQGGRVTNRRDLADSSVALAGNGMNWAADTLAGRFVPVGADDGVSTLRIRISRVQRLQDYAGITRFLNAQTSIENATLLFAEPDALTFDLQVRGGTQVLEQGLELSHMIEPEGEPPTSENTIFDNVDLYYRMRE